MTTADVLQRDSLFHRVHPLVKFFCLTVLAVALPTLHRPASLLIVAATVWLVVIAVARIPVGFILSHATILLLVPTGLLVFHTITGQLPSMRIGFIVITTDGWLKGLDYFVRFSTIIVASLLFVWTTSPGAVLGACRQIRIPDRLAYTGYLGLRLIPVVAADLEELRLSHRLRRRGGWSPATRLDLWTRLFVGAVVISVARADLLASSMDLRGFSREGPRSLAQPPYLSWWHVVFAMLFTLLLILARLLSERLP